MAKKVAANESVAAPRLKPSALLDTRVVYCGDNLEPLAKLPAAGVDLIYIDPPFNSSRSRTTARRAVVPAAAGRLESSSNITIDIHQTIS
jgi:16S rRNA G966 N2-methylase RsmD